MGHKTAMTPKKAAAYRASADAPPVEMTDREADEEAKRRWGPSGVAWHPSYWRRGESHFCQVGAMVGELRNDWQIFGSGPTWAKAFLDAEARGH